MSSILRALKKLEKTPQQKMTVEPWLLESGTRRTPGGGRVLRVRIFYILLAIPFLLLAGWRLLEFGSAVTERYFPGKPHRIPVEAVSKHLPEGNNNLPAKAQLKPPDKKPQPVAEKAVKPMAAIPETGIAAKSGMTVSEKRGGNMTAGVENRKRGQNLQTGAKQARAAPGASMKKEGASAKSAAATRGRIPLSIKSQNSDPRSAKPGSMFSDGEPTPVKNTGETGFQVQAIAWSSIPEKRIAVINGGIVREGEYVDGAYVAKISLDSVSLKKGEKTWKQGCGR